MRRVRVAGQFRSRSFIKNDIGVKNLGIVQSNSTSNKDPLSIITATSNALKNIGNDGDRAPQNNSKAVKLIGTSFLTTPGEGLDTGMETDT